MDFTVINSLQILRISPKCGLRTGVDGRLSIYWFQQFFIALMWLFSYSRVNLPSQFRLFYPRFLSFGGASPYRPVEDLAFAVARFYQNGGTFQNYYMVLTCEVLIVVDRIIQLFTLPRKEWARDSWSQFCFIFSYTVPWWDKLWQDYWWTVYCY